MEALAQKTLAQIVIEDHRTASVFEKYDLDFCCKGKRPLAQACSDQQIDVNEVLTDISNLDNTPKQTTPFKYFTATQLVDYIVNTHHSYTKKELPLIFQYLQKVALKHGGRHPELLQIFDLFEQLKAEMESHMQKEEELIFPLITRMQDETATFSDTDPARMREFINAMESEHDQAGELIAQIKTLTNNYTPPSDACTTYWLSFISLDAFERDLHHHVHLENYVLVPKVLECLEASGPSCDSCSIANRSVR